MTILTDTPTAPGPTATNSVRLPPRRTRLRGIPLSYLWCAVSYTHLTLPTTSRV